MLALTLWDILGGLAVLFILFGVMALLGDFLTPRRGPKK